MICVLYKEGRSLIFPTRFLFTYANINMKDGRFKIYFLFLFVSCWDRHSWRHSYCFKRTLIGCWLVKFWIGLWENGTRGLDSFITDFTSHFWQSKWAWCTRTFCVELFLGFQLKRLERLDYVAAFVQWFQYEQRFFNIRKGFFAQYSFRKSVITCDPLLLSVQLIAF